MENIMKFNYVLLVLFILMLISCKTEAKTPSKVPKKTAYNIQVKPTETKQIKPTIKLSDNSNERKPTIFSSKFEYNKFSVNLEEKFKNIVENEFEQISEKAGISVAVYKEGTLWTYAIGIASESEKLKTNTPFMISSTSKTFLSALILTQIENGLYGLNDTLDTIFSDYPEYLLFDWNIINPQVTIEELLTMSSGLSVYSDNIEERNILIKNPELTPIDLINLIKTPYSESGNFKYNDTNVVLLGLIAELYSGQTLAELYRQNFYIPLSLTALTLPEEGIKWHKNISQDPASNFTLPHIAMPYTDISKWSSGFGNMIDAAPFEFGYYIGSMGRTRYACCGIISTPENIARWAYHLYSPNGMAVSESIKIKLKNSTSLDNIPPWSSSTRPGSIPGEYGYLVSKKIFKNQELITTTYGHPGGGSGYSGWMHYSPDLDLAISIMTNSQMNFIGSCKVENPGDCISMNIFQAYKDLQLSK